MSATRRIDGMAPRRSRLASPRSRRVGAWYVAEHRLRVMRAYGGRHRDGVGSPFLYLFAFGVGLATLVSAIGDDAVEGVSYLVFVAPALLCTAP